MSYIEHFICVLECFVMSQVAVTIKHGVEYSKPAARSIRKWCAPFGYGSMVKQHVSSKGMKRCAMGYEVRFLSFGGCVSSEVHINLTPY